MFSRLSELAFPVVLEPGGDPALVLGGHGSSSVLIATVPKSGTHLAAELLSGLGLLDARIHLSPNADIDWAEDRRYLVPGEAHRGPVFPTDASSWKRYPIPFGTVMGLVRPGQFVQGHVPFVLPNQALELAGAKVVYVRRRLRDMVISAMRFVETLNLPRGGDLDTMWWGAPETPEKVIAYLDSYGRGFVPLTAALAPWRGRPETIELDFDLVVDPARTNEAVSHLLELADHVGAETNESEIGEVMRKAVFSPTATWTGRLSRHEEWWTDAVEAKFIEIGLAALDPML